MSILSITIKIDELEFVKEFCKKYEGEILHIGTLSNSHMLSIRISEERAFELISLKK